MKALITGASGTVGSALTDHLTQLGHTPIAWDRSQVPYDDYHSMLGYILLIKPDVVYHLAVASQPQGHENEEWWVTFHWTGELAWICRQLAIRFIFTSSVMVWSDNASGPFTPDSPPDVTEGYGHIKLQAEQRAMHQNPDAIVARLGWQIGAAAGSNNMVDFFAQQMKEQGEIRASRRWLPACSFVQDTAAALTALATLSPGLYLVDSNTRWSFYEIALALDAVHGHRWRVFADDSFVFDQRMQDPRVPIAPLSERLPSLESR